MGEYVENIRLERILLKNFRSERAHHKLDLNLQAPASELERQASNIHHLKGVSVKIN